MYWDTLGRSVIAKEERDDADRIITFLNISGISGTMALDEKTGLYFVSVPDTQAEAARKLLDTGFRREKDAASAAPASKTEKKLLSEKPGVNLYEQRRQDIRSAMSAAAFLLIAGALLTSFILFRNYFFRPQAGSALNSPISVLELLFGFSLLLMGILALMKARTIRTRFREEEAFASSAIEWFLSTYSADQLDDSLQAAGVPVYLSHTERQEKRLSLISDYLEREYPSSSHAMQKYLSREIYISIFEQPKLTLRG